MSTSDTTRTVSVNTTPWALILFVIFLVLKLTGTIGWSWLWVTAPLWFPFALFLGLLLLFLGVPAIAGAVTVKRK